MHRAHAFNKLTKKGTVLRVVKERYLRDDVACGSVVRDDDAPLRASPDRLFAPLARLAAPRRGPPAPRPNARMH